MSLWFSNVTAYSIQVGLIAGTAVLLCSLARLRAPGIQLHFWQGLLAACLLMPLLQTRQPAALPAPVSALTTVTIEEGDTSPGPRISAINLNAPSLILLALAGGSLWHLLRLAAGLYRLRALRLGAQPIGVPDGAAELMSRLKARADFRISPAVTSPVTFGWRRPTILFPPAFAGWDMTRCRMLVCHELLHVRRRDWLAIFTEELIKVALWFHPGVRWILKRIRLCREQVIDRQVVEITGAREAYVRSLIEIAAPQTTPAIPAPLLLREHDLMPRISALTQEVRMSRGRVIISLIFIIAVLASTVFWSVSAFPLRSQPLENSHQSSRTVQGNVYDPQGRPVAGAMVRAFDAGDRLLAEARTDSAGHFELALPDASASLRVLHPGFKIADLELDKVREAPAKVVLKLGEISETVKVRVPPATQAANPAAVPATATAKTALHVGGNRQAQKLITKVDPVYPREAKLQSIEGSVVLQITVSETGNVTDAKVISGPEALRGSAVDAVRQWVYEPTYLNGEPIAVIATVTINYTLAGKAAVRSTSESGGEVRPPRLLHQVNAEYPVRAKEEGISGVVVLRIRIDEAGNVSNVSVVSGHPLLRDSAIVAINQWRYSPTLLNGSPVATEATVTFDFSLK